MRIAGVSVDDEGDRFKKKFMIQVADLKQSRDKRERKMRRRGTVSTKNYCTDGISKISKSKRAP